MSNSSPQVLNDADQVYNFIVSSIDEYDLNRFDDPDEDGSLGFKDYTALTRFNRSHVDKLAKTKPSFLKFLLALKQEIVAGDVSHMDKEGMSMFSMSGYVFSSTGGLVTFNER